MFVARVVGHIVSTQKDDRLIGSKLLLVERLDPNENPIGTPLVAVDTVCAGSGEQVLVTTGHSARVAANDTNIPIDAAIVGIIDTVDILV